MPFNFDDLSYIQFLMTLNNRIDDSMDDTDQNMNTVIQFFEAPYDEITLGSIVLTNNIPDPNANMVWGSSSVNPTWTYDNNGVYDPFFTASTSCTETVTLSASVQTVNNFNSDLAWGSSTVNTNWYWGFGGVYQ